MPNFDKTLARDMNLFSMVIKLPSFINGRQTIDNQSLRHQGWYEPNGIRNDRRCSVDQSTDLAPSLSALPSSSTTLATITTDHVEDDGTASLASSLLENSESDLEFERIDRHNITHLSQTHSGTRQTQTETTTLAAVCILPDLDAMSDQAVDTR